MRFYETEIQKFLCFSYKVRYVNVVHLYHNNEKVTEIANPEIFKTYKANTPKMQAMKNDTRKEDGLEKTDAETAAKP